MLLCRTQKSTSLHALNVVYIFIFRYYIEVINKFCDDTARKARRWLQRPRSSATILTPGAEYFTDLS